MDNGISIRKMGNTGYDASRLVSFLQSIDKIFPIHLSEKIEIDNYAFKILTKGIVLYAEFEGEIIGSILGYSNDTISKAAYVSTFGILKSYRNLGIGEQLLSEMKKTCRNNGMKKISLYTHESNKSGIRFYKRHGFIEKPDPEKRSGDIYLECNLKILENKDESHNKNILVTAIGSFSADIIIKTLKGQNYYVVGCDIYEKGWLVDASNVDLFYQAPYVSYEDEYINFIEKTCKEHNVKYVFPLTDPEVDLLSSKKVRLEEKGICICTSNEDTVKLCRDKYKLPQFLIEQGIKNIIPTKLVHEDDNIKFPAFIKPISGRSSQGCKVISNKKQYDYFKSELITSEYIVQPQIKGNIITVDVIRDPIVDKVVCIARRELLRNESGAGTTVEIIENLKLEEICTSIARKVDIIGAVNIEFIETDTGEFYFLEINPRFSGGLEFSHISGYDLVSNHLRVFMNKKIEPKKAIKKMIIARKYEEYITKFLEE